MNYEKTFDEQEILFKEKTGKDFNTLYTKYYPKLIYYVNQICQDTQKAEDISTDSFFQALEKIDQYKPEKAQFSTWLFTIARNIALQEKKLTSRNMSMDITFDDEGTTLKDFIQETDSNEWFYDVINKKADIMKEHINKLKEPYKTVITLRELEKMTYQEIADKLEINLSTLKSRIRQGRHLLMSQTKLEFTEIDNLYI